MLLKIQCYKIYYCTEKFLNEATIVGRGGYAIAAKGVASRVKNFSICNLFDIVTSKNR